MVSFALLILLQQKEMVVGAVKIQVYIYMLLQQAKVRSAHQVITLIL